MRDGSAGRHVHLSSASSSGSAAGRRGRVVEITACGLRYTDHTDVWRGVMSIYETEPLSHVTQAITSACALSYFGWQNAGSAR